MARAGGGRIVLADTLTAACVLATALGVAFWVIDRDYPVPVTSSSRAASTVQAVCYLALPFLGSLIARRRGGPIGWLLSGIGVTIAGWIAADGWAVHTLLVAPGSLAGGVLAAWVANWIWTVGWTLTALLFLLFPTGRVPVRAGRLVLAVGLGAGGLALAAYALAPGPLDKYPHVVNPFGVGGPAVAALQPSVTGVVPLLCFGAAAITGLVLRYRSSRGLERRQLGVLALPGAAVVASVAALQLLGSLGLRWNALEQVVMVSTAAIPVAAGLAVLRYGLYDVDRALRRALAYAVVSALLGLVYGLTAVGLGSLLDVVGERSSVDVAAATLLVAALARPALRHVQHAVDRRFDRRRHDARLGLLRFRARLRDEVDLDAVVAATVRAAGEVAGPVSVSVWLRPSGSASPAAPWSKSEQAPRR